MHGLDDGLAQPYAVRRSALIAEQGLQVPLGYIFLRHILIPEFLSALKVTQSNQDE